MKALLKNYRQSPRKVRLVAYSVRGKSVEEALRIVSFLPKRAALPVKKLILSAVANAEKNSGADRKNLFIQDIQVNKGIVMKRHMPRAFGRASQIKKRSSHVTIVLVEKDAFPKKPKKEKIRNEVSEIKSTKRPKKREAVTTS